jgi:hypothetical protein
MTLREHAGIALLAFVFLGSVIVIIVSALRSVLRLLFSNKARRQAIDATKDSLNVAGSGLDYLTERLHANARGLLPRNFHGSTRGVKRWVIGLSLGAIALLFARSFAAGYDDAGLFAIFCCIVACMYFAIWRIRRSSELWSKQQDRSGTPFVS